MPWQQRRCKFQMNLVQVVSIIGQYFESFEFNLFHLAEPHQVLLHLIAIRYHICDVFIILLDRLLCHLRHIPIGCHYSLAFLAASHHGLPLMRIRTSDGTRSDFALRAGVLGHWLFADHAYYLFVGLLDWNILSLWLWLFSLTLLQLIIKFQCAILAHTLNVVYYIARYFIICN